MLLPIHLLRSKPFPSFHIARERIVNLFVNFEHAKVIAVEAPAGYGKSVAVAEYVHTLIHPYVWLPMELIEGLDHLTFVLNLLNAIRQTIPGFGESILTLFNDNNDAQNIQDANLIRNRIVPKIITELAQLERQMTIVIEDYHEVKKEIIHDLTTYLILYSSENIQFIITTREHIPWNNRSRMLGEDKMKLITRQLYFDNLGARC